MQDESGNRGPYADAVDGYERIWTRIARVGRLPYVPVTEPGWDARPLRGDKALVRTGRTPAKFRDMLTRARAFVDRHPLAGGQRLVLVEARDEDGAGAGGGAHHQRGV